MKFSTASLTEVVRNYMDKRAAVCFIAGKSQMEILSGDWARFVEVVETELGRLHGEILSVTSLHFIIGTSGKSGL